MNILFATSEAAPLAKTGGLGDVAGALPKALVKRQIGTSVILPKYEDIPAEYLEYFEQIASFNVSFSWRNQYCGLFRGEIDGVCYYLIDNEFYFKRRGLYGYGDDPERFVFFSFAVLEALSFVDVLPDVIHCHDWQTALIPFLLKTKYAAEWADIRTVFTIHNLKYQGVLGIKQLQDLTGAGDEAFGPAGLEFHGAASCLKGGLVYADKLTTVSHTYAEEIKGSEYGERLEELLRHREGDLLGIVNGIDDESYDPMKDSALHTPYRNSISRKRKNKLDLQQELGLPESEEIPLIGMVNRLVEQKGLDLITARLEELLQEDVQLVILGSGEWHYEQQLQQFAQRYPDKIAVKLGYNERLARRIYAGADLYLLPSRFEPCGISQLLALRYRAVPIVRETGGLKDTVQSFDEYTGEGNGFSFVGYDADEYWSTVSRALRVYRNPEAWKQIIDNVSKENYSWNRSAKAYIAVYHQLLLQREENKQCPVTL
ncbi:starch synthase [Paenibacillus algorifonticola]|uniref:Glycogen synthase n=1 Tax=Paenibacillus algorifonticola TaxID=684063 RepID=A0A1I1ZTM0_9BACL|nr:glycogen synthase GlgA [Paenibacillus algorifonticola]SFE35154.1 starch synthase [Paenibacillus algorifonticola]